ncbi:MAG: hypothetical protein GY827_11670 [Cytophagales bacterium]|nr:hypothetical protein [Cytophagales bacterium]
MSASAQIPFAHLFKEIETTKLHVYTHARITFTETTTFPFKGKKIEKSEKAFWKALADTSDLKYDKYDELFATYHFAVSKDLEAFIVRQSMSEGIENPVYYLLYDIPKKKFVKMYFLAHAYGYESASGTTETWLVDLNNDGYKDFLTYSLSEHSIMDTLGDVEFVYTEETSVTFFEKGNLKKVMVQDSSLIKNLRKDFPLYRSFYPNRETITGLVSLCKENQIEYAEGYKEEWVVILSSDETLEGALTEKKKFEKTFVNETRYGVSPWSTEIYKNNGRYYTVLDSYYYKRPQAEIAQRLMQQKFNKTAYVVNVKKWCSYYEYEKGCRICKKEKHRK